MLWLSHVSVPMRMSGSCVEMKLPSSAVLFLILWTFILMILRGLWACLSAVVVLFHIWKRTRDCTAIAYDTGDATIPINDGDDERTGTLV